MREEPELTSILDFIASRNKNTAVSIEKITLDKCSPWYYDGISGTIHNQNRSFFEIRGQDRHIGTELPYCIIKQPQKYEYLSVSSLCSAGKSFFVIDPSGYVKVCNHSPQQICKWNEMEKLNDSEYWRRFSSSDYIPKMCKECKHLGIKCDGGCREAAHVAIGAIDDMDPCFE